MYMVLRCYGVTVLWWYGVTVLYSVTVKMFILLSVLEHNLATNWYLGTQKYATLTSLHVPETPPSHAKVPQSSFKSPT